MPDKSSMPGLTVCNACFCCNTLLYFDVPDCIGCAGAGQCLCCRQAACCNIKGLSDSYAVGLTKKDGDLFGIGLFCCECAINTSFIADKFCCKSQGQECCFVGNMLFPPASLVGGKGDADIPTPMICGLCTLVLFPTDKIGVFKPLSTFQ